jgi:hypothetical protein
MDNPPFHRDRVGVIVASALGLVTAAYFELEMRDVVPNLFADRSPLAGVFSERMQAHANVIADPGLRALGFALALVASVAMLRSDADRSWWLRITYGVGTLVFPIIALLLTLVAQPLALGELCVPCLLQSLFALAILECRSNPFRPLVTDPVGTRSLEG